MIKYHEYLENLNEEVSAGDVNRKVRLKSDPNVTGTVVALAGTKLKPSYKIKLDNGSLVYHDADKVEFIKKEQNINPPSTPKFKRGDKVVFNPAPSRGYYAMMKGAKCEILHVYPRVGKDQGYSIVPDGKGGPGTYADEAELTLVGDKSSNKMADYIENQFNKDKQDKGNEIKVGSRVIVNGEEDGFNFENRKGTVKKVGPKTCVIDFDEDESKNYAAYTLSVSKDLIKLLEETSVRSYKEGDKVKCIEQGHDLDNKIGIVEKVWKDDNSCQVKFENEGGSGYISIFLLPHQIEMVEPAKNAGFETDIPINPQTSNATEEEDEEDVVDAKTVPLKKEDLLELSYKQLFKEKFISTREDLKAVKAKHEQPVSGESKMKEIFREKTLKILDVIDSYYDFLVNKIAKDLPVYRTVEDIKNADLLRNKTKVRASDSKEMTKKYSFDQGIIAYWKFKDAVVFKTI